MRFRADVNKKRFRRPQPPTVHELCSDFVAFASDALSEPISHKDHAAQRDPASVCSNNTGKIIRVSTEFQSGLRRLIAEQKLLSFSSANLRGSIRVPPPYRRKICRFQFRHFVGLPGFRQMEILGGPKIRANVPKCKGACPQRLNRGLRTHLSSSPKSSLFHADAWKETKDAQPWSLSIVCGRHNRSASALMARARRRHDPEGVHRACGGMVQRPCASSGRLGLHPICWLGEGR
jgi:hypothetical protein